MSEKVLLQASDGHEFGGYVAHPAHEPKAALIVVQEIFGVNPHIRSVADGYAKDGFLVIAPAMFDRYERDVEIGYDKAGWAHAAELRNQANIDLALLDISAAIDWLRNEVEKPVGIVGYCFGGSMAWLSACRLDVDAAVAYYGAMIPKFVDEQPKVPVMLHFGREDTHIPAVELAKIEKKHPEVPLFLYNAGHAFNRDSDPKAYNSVAAREARKRTLMFFEQHLVF